MAGIGPLSARAPTTARLLVGFATLAVAFAGCGGKSSHSTGPSGGSELLIALNASQNDGRTVRWASLPSRCS
jgi:hypothetical protein